MQCIQYTEAYDLRDIAKTTSIFCLLELLNYTNTVMVLYAA